MTDDCPAPQSPRPPKLLARPADCCEVTALSPEVYVMLARKLHVRFEGQPFSRFSTPRASPGQDPLGRLAPHHLQRQPEDSDSDDLGFINAEFVPEGGAELAPCPEGRAGGSSEFDDLLPSGPQPDANSPRGPGCSAGDPAAGREASPRGLRFAPPAEGREISDGDAGAGPSSPGSRCGVAESRLSSVFSGCDSAVSTRGLSGFCVDDLEIAPPHMFKGPDPRSSLRGLSCNPWGSGAMASGRRPFRRSASENNVSDLSTLTVAPLMARHVHAFGKRASVAG